ncbi:MAG TPA: lysophospholipid acyltransferase family protein [Methylomirabilota bacterium]|nr:lysophospholipid acyltransferase family protein [Methylomirabilota bacterium]
MRTRVLDLWRPSLHHFCRFYFRLQLRGTEHIPSAGALIVVPNHQTYADPPLVTIPIRRPVHYMAWSRLFEIPGFGGLIRLLRAFPVELESRDPRAARHAARLVQAGEVLMMFPEGGRSLDGTVGRFKPGAFRLAVSFAVPILPVTIAGAHESWPPGRILPRRHRITITYHAPLRPDPSLDPREAARDLAARTKTIIESALTTTNPTAR